MEGNTHEIAIYVACLAAYNNGILHGAWISADQEPEDIRAEISAMLNTSPMPGAEEYAIHDYEGFGSLRLSEYEDLHGVSQQAAFIAEHGELGAELIAYFGDVDSAKDAMEDRYAGQYENLEDFAEELTEQTTDIPESLSFYIDYEKMARDLEIDDVTTIEANGTVHVFWNG